MRYLSLTKILEFYDVPQIFLATDVFMSNLICVLMDMFPRDGFEYFAVQLSKERLNRFLSGEYDLRSLYVNPEIEDSYFKVIVKEQKIIAESYDGLITEDMLPSEGYYYEENEDLENYELIERTQRERFTIFRLGFVDQNNSHEIDTECLAQAISAFQHTVTNCHQKIRGKQNLIESNLKVTTFKAASFDVEFKSSSRVDLFGGSYLTDTFSLFDKLMNTDNEEEFKSILKSIQGRTVSSYRQFIKILEENGLAIKYKWVSSIVDKNISSSFVQRSRIDQIYELLNRNEKLTTEEVEYEGVFLASSVENGKWMLQSKVDNSIISGDSETSSLLSGVTIESAKYKIRCVESQVQNVATLKTEIKRVLISIESL